MFGEAAYAALIVGGVVRFGFTAGDLLPSLAWSPVAGVVGAVVGGVISLVSGLALALSSRSVLAETNRARLVTGAAAAAVPVAVMVNSDASGHLIATGIAMAAAVTAVLVTPRILDGPRPAGKWQPGVRPAPPARTTRAEQ